MEPDSWDTVSLMICPSCSESLSEVDHAGVRVHACSCGGMWFDRDELQARMASSGHPDPSGDPEHADLLDGNLNRCPKCSIESLQRFEVGQIRGAHCRECGGIWQSAVDAHRLRLAAMEANSIPRSGAAGAGVDETMARIIVSLMPAL